LGNCPPQLLQVYTTLPAFLEAAIDPLYPICTVLLHEDKGKNLKSILAQRRKDAKEARKSKQT
jgi:hypothetical protein